MSSANPVWVIPYEATSSCSGTLAAGEAIAEIVRVLGHSGAMRRIDVASLDAEQMDQHLLAELAQHGMPKVVFGGNHLVSYPVMKAYARTGGRRVLVFDAHHDGYVVPQLTHYSHFHHLVELFDLEITIVGCRYELEKADPRIRFLSISDLPGYLQAGGRLYVSVDLDVLDPESFGSVNHPVPNGLILGELQGALELVFSSSPDCVDLVEPSLSKHCTKDSLDVLTSLVGTFVKYGLSSAMDLPRQDRVQPPSHRPSCMG